MKYLFFDIEGANCYNYFSKMCTFGYVITNEKFEMLSKVDVIMNPEAHFDKHIIAKKMNAYPISKYQSCPPFNYFYNSIKKIIENKNQIIVGWSIENDVKYIHDACSRYNLKQIRYVYADLQSIFMKVEGLSNHPSLESACEKYNIPLLVNHKSDDDAYLTMMLASKLCEKLNVSLYTLIMMYKDSCSSYDEYSSHLLSGEELQQKINKKKIISYINKCEIKKSINSPFINENDVYGISMFLIDSYGLELRKVIKHIKKCGAKCTTVLDKATIIVDSLDQLSHHKTNKNGLSVKMLSYEKLLELINIDNKIKV